MKLNQTKNKAKVDFAKKLLVSNRGEIAIRIFRTAAERGWGTVAIYSHEDRFSLHRFKADEGYQVGQAGIPVASYMDIDSILEIAEKSKIRAIHPGYGFLSEQEKLCRKVEQAGMLFVGPTEDTLRVAGDKVLSREMAQKAGVQIIRGSETLENYEAAREFAESISYPVILKALFGGGGRGMRVVRNAAELEANYLEAQTEARNAFGKPEIFLEKFIENPKHIEVQLLGDGCGNVVHLFERDCSIQRRHQKILEIAPASNLTAQQKEKLRDYALKIGKAINLRSAATVEFLIAKDGEVFFIEINPRIQVEHTVTEEITGIDIVRAQLEIAEGATLDQLGLQQDSLKINGTAIQCRVTTEDPTNNFQPDYGRIVAYRSASGMGIRLDAGSAYAGAEVLPYYDSLLVKVTAWGNSLEGACHKLRRALSEFRVRGVKTNIVFMENLLHHPEILAGKARVGFLQDHPEVFKLPRRRNRASRYLNFLAEVTVNGHEQMPGLKRVDVKEIPVLPELPKEELAEKSSFSWRNFFYDKGRDEFRKRLKEEKSLLITDTTFRDAHQSLLATRMRTFDMLQVAPHVGRLTPQLFSLEMWGGATYDVMLRFLLEDPWIRLEKLREAVPNILFQMLIRGDNAVGYMSYPRNVVEGFIEQAHQKGIDVFRIFDSLNNPSRMETAMSAVNRSGAIAEACICYTGDLLGEPKGKYNLDYYLRTARQLRDMGADILAIKDMAGLLRPASASILIEALKEEIDLPIHLHTHDTAGVQASTYMSAANAGVNIIDCAFSALAGVTSQPALEGMVAAFENTARDTKLDLNSLTSISSYWEVVRRQYKPFESELSSMTGEVYLHEMPGGQYSNFRKQAESFGISGKWKEIKDTYRQVNKLFGGVVKVTPSSKVVGDMTLYMVANGLTAEDVNQRASELDLPDSVVNFLAGGIGIPEGGFPVELQEAVLKRKRLKKAVELPDASIDAARVESSKLLGEPATIGDALSYLLYPEVFKNYSKKKKDYGDLSLVPTNAFFYGLEEGEEIEIEMEPGKRIIVKLTAIGEPDNQSMRAVFFELNGQQRNILVRDLSLSSTLALRRKASESELDVGAPVAGGVVAVSVESGDKLKKGDPLLVLEAMKMQTVVQSPVDGIIKEVVLREGERVDVGDLLIVLE